MPRVLSSVQHQTAQPRKPTLNSAKDKVNPDVARDAARNKISKLEKALEVLSDSTGPAVDALKSELEKARQAAKVPPLNVQISSTQDFIRRSERRLAELEEERTAESKLLEEARERLRQLEAARCAQEAVASSPSAGLGDPSPDSAADGQSIAGRARCVGEGSPERPCGETQSAPAVVRATCCRRHHPTNANIGSTRAQRVDGRPSVRHARGHVVRKSEEVVGVDVPSRPGRRETRRDDRRHGSMMSSRRTISRYGYRGCRVGEATHPGPSVLRSNLLKREARPCASRRRSRFTQVDSDCEPLLHDGGVANDSEEETQVVSVHQTPGNSVIEGRVALPVRQISSRVPKRLRLTGHHHGTAPTDDICDALEFDLTQGDSSGLDAPPPLPPPILPPPCVPHTQVDSDVDVQATALDRPTSPPPSLIQDLQYDPAMGVEVGGTVPESDSSSTMSLVEDGGSVAGSAGHAVEAQGVEEVPQVRARAVAVGMASLDGLDLHAIFRRRAVVMRTVPSFLKGAFTAALKVAFDECIAARAHGDETREVRAWKLFLLIPRMLLHRPPRSGLVPRKRLEERFRSFEAGEWESLVLQSMPGAEQAAEARGLRVSSCWTNLALRRCVAAPSRSHVEIHGRRPECGGLSLFGLQACFRMHGETLRETRSWGRNMLLSSPSLWHPTSQRVTT